MKSHITIRVLSKDFEVSFGSMKHIIRQGLSYRKVYSQWIHWVSISKKKNSNLMAVHLKPFISFSVEINKLLEHIVAGNESWCHHCCEPVSKTPTMQCCHPLSLRPNKLKRQSSAGKVTLIFLFDDSSPLFIDFKDPDVYLW